MNGYNRGLESAISVIEEKIKAMEFNTKEK
jgi:uncharacterized protein (DUF2164 family)